MGNPIAVPLRSAYKLINHGPTTLISTCANGRSNVMAAAWVMAIDFEPPKVAAVIAADTLTRELLLASGECVIQVPTRAQAALTYAVGTVSGREQDKMRAQAIATEPGEKVAAPRIAGCAAWLECRRIPEPEIEARYDLFVFEVVAVFVDQARWDGRGWTDPGSIHHAYKGTFFATGERITAT